MGTLSDDMASGAACSECGVYFKEAHGHAVLCHSCWDEGEDNRRTALTPRSIIEEVNKGNSE